MGGLPDPICDAVPADAGAWRRGSCFPGPAEAVQDGAGSGVDGRRGRRGRRRTRSHASADHRTSRASLHGR